MLRRFAVAMGSTVTLVGAFIVGGVLHQAVVKGAYAVTSPPAVLGVALGLAVILVGKRLEARFDPSEYVPDAKEEDEDEEGEEFDEKYSPVPEERLEDREDDDREFDERFSPVPQERLEDRDRDDGRSQRDLEQE